MKCAIINSTQHLHRSPYTISFSFSVTSDIRISELQINNREGEIAHVGRFLSSNGDFPADSLACSL